MMTPWLYIKSIPWFSSFAFAVRVDCLVDFSCLVVENQEEKEKERRFLNFGLCYKDGGAKSYSPKPNLGGAC